MGWAAWRTLQTNSFGNLNSPPRVGPLVISEINYHPGEPSVEARAVDATLDANDLEFIEIHNPTAAAVDLFGWRLRGGVDFDFRAGTQLGPGGTLLIVPFNPEGLGNGTRTNAFRTQYGINDQVILVGGYQGQLSDSYDRVELQRPGTPPVDDPAFVPQLTEDEVRYDDLAPWPTAADGSGATLTRTSVTAYGNSSNSWLATMPSPGAVSNVSGDLNNDGMVDASDIDTLCQAIEAGESSADLDGDGVVDNRDLTFFVHNVIGTSIGDANLDGIFNSADFVFVLTVGEYEDGVPNNSTWAEGDWNCDGEFDTSDFVAALQAGGYQSEATAANVHAGRLTARPGNLVRSALDGTSHFARSTASRLQRSSTIVPTALHF